MNPKLSLVRLAVFLLTCFLFTDLSFWANERKIIHNLTLKYHLKWIFLIDKAFQNPNHILVVINCWGNLSFVHWLDSKVASFKAENYILQDFKLLWSCLTNFEMKKFRGKLAWLVTWISRVWIHPTVQGFYLKLGR